jgi:hypothetical protein
MTDQDDALVRFEIPASFVLTRVLPTGAELAYGFRHGWLRRPDVVRIALAKYEAGICLSAPEEELALLLSDDFDQVDDLVSRLDAQDEPVEQRARLWLFLALSWLHEHRDSFEDPFEVIEMLYADFGYPEEIRGLVRYMPPVPDQIAGLNAISDRWLTYLDRVGVDYRQRELPCQSDDST